MVGLAQLTLGTAVGLDDANEGGNIPALANIVFSRYVFAFEVTSALLITAAVGAMVLAHRERLTPKLTQADLAAKRVRDYAEQGRAPRPAARRPASTRATTRSTPRRCCPTAPPPSRRSPGSSPRAAPSARRPALADDIEELKRQLGVDTDAPSQHLRQGPRPGLDHRGRREGTRCLT